MYENRVETTIIFNIRILIMWIRHLFKILNW